MIIDLAEAREVLIRALTSAATIAKSNQPHATASAPIKAPASIDRSEQELLNAEAHTDIENAIQDEIVGSMLAKYSDLDVICEEYTALAAAHVRPGARYALLVDPIDFTRDYMEGGSRYAITAALCDSGVPVVAVAQFPAQSQTLLCTAGEGLLRLRDGRMTRWSSSLRSSRTLIANTRALLRMKQELKSEYECEPMQFTLEDVLRCVDGNVAAVISCRNKAHDVAPAALFAREAGLSVGICRDPDLRFDRGALDRDLRLHGCLVVAATESVMEDVMALFTS